MAWMEIAKSIRRKREYVQPVKKTQSQACSVHQVANEHGILKNYFIYLITLTYNNDHIAI